MKYITREDLIEVIQGRLLDESVSELPDELLDGLESKAIDFAASYISGRYDTDKIFSLPPTPSERGGVLRNGLLVQAIAMIVVYRAVRRNAARKVPDDFPDMYAEAIRILNNIQTGAQSLAGLPEVTGDTGTTGSLMYGNNTNKDFFI
jgi:phage gp36-like protein